MATAEPKKRLTPAQHLEKALKERTPTPEDYVDTKPPAGVADSSLRVVPKEMKDALYRVGGCVVVQSPVGQPRDTDPKSKRPYIIELRPNFDGPGKVKPAGGSGGSAPRRQPRQVNFPRGYFPVPETMLPLDFAQVRAYMEAVNGDAQREYEHRKQTGLTEQEVNRSIKGLSGQLLLSKLRQLEDEQGRTFEQHLNLNLGFPTEMIRLFGIPEPGPDRKDDHKGGNGALTPPKPKPTGAGKK